MSRFLAFLLCLGLPATAAAHEIVTNDGTRYEGKIVLESDQQVVIETTFDGRKAIARADIKTLNKDVPPLVDQLAYRRKKAHEDPKALYAVYKWAKGKGFKLEHLQHVLERILELDGNHKRARKLLGHEKVDGTWMSPAQKKQHLIEQQAAEMRAKGLVLYEGEWVTPREAEAREKGLKRDGDDWVTEEEWHKRRGEVLRDGKWIKLGFEDGQKFHKEVRKGSRLKVAYEWGPHFDAYFDTSGDDAKKILASCEKAFSVMRRVLRPTAEDFPEDARTSLFLVKKLPGYVRLSQWFANRYRVEEVAKGWKNSIKRQHAWWWVQDHMAVCAYKFPNTHKTFNSNVVHHLGHTLLTRYKMNFAFPKPWLLKGFSYFLEMEANGYSLTFSLGRGMGTVETGENTDRPAWAESEKWRGALKAAVDAGQDPSLARIAKMSSGQFRYVELVKSWSMVAFLVSWDAAKFKRFIDLSKDRELTEEQALKQAYGTGYRGVNRRWRDYVTAGFKHPHEVPPPAPATK